MNLQYIEQALKEGKKSVSVIKKIKNLQTGEIISKTEIQVDPRWALKIFKQPLNKRPFLWRSLEPLTGNPEIPQEPKIDRNSLSAPSLLEQIAADPELMKKIKEIEKANKQAEKELKAASLGSDETNSLKTAE